MTEKRAHYLRLVATGEAIPNDLARDRTIGGPVARLVPRRAEQLHLPHLDRLTLILASELAFRGLDDFSDCMKAFEPVWVIDVRRVPRLDVLGGARKHFFSILSRHRSKYVDLLGQLEVHWDRPAEIAPVNWGRKLAERVSESQIRGGNILLLFDSANLMRESAASLPGTLQEAIHSQVAIATLDA